MVGDPDGRITGPIPDDYGEVVEGLREAEEALWRAMQQVQRILPFREAARINAVRERIVNLRMEFELKMEKRFGADGVHPKVRTVKRALKVGLGAQTARAMGPWRENYSCHQFSAAVSRNAR